MAAIRISIGLYEIVQLRSGDGVALPLSLIVGVVGLTLSRGMGVRLLGRFFVKKKITLFLLFWPIFFLIVLFAN